MKRLSIAIILFTLSCPYLFSQIGYIFKENRTDTLLGAMNPKGEIIFNNEFTSIEFIYGYILSEKPKSVGYDLFDFKTRHFMDDSVSTFICVSNRHALIKKYQKDDKGKWGLVDKTGKQITGYIYDDIYDKKTINDLVKVIKNGKYLLVDTTGKSLVSETSRAKFLKKIKKYSIVQNNDNSTVGKFTYHVAKDADIFQNLTTKKYGLKQGNNIVLKDEYDKIEKTGNDNFIIKSQSKYGVALPNGKIILDVVFDEITEALYWKIIAVYNGKYGAYDGKNGKAIIKPEYGFLTFL